MQFSFSKHARHIIPCLYTLTCIYVCVLGFKYRVPKNLLTMSLTHYCSFHSRFKDVRVLQTFDANGTTDYHVGKVKEDRNPHFFGAGYKHTCTMSNICAQICTLSHGWTLCVCTNYV